MVAQNTNTPDHDLLIELNKSFDIFTRQYHLDMKNLNDGITAQIVEQKLQIKDHDKRLDEVERVLGVVKPEETLKDYLTFKQDIRDIIIKANTVANVSRIAGGAIGALIVLLAKEIPRWIEVLGNL